MTERKGGTARVQAGASFLACASIAPDAFDVAFFSVPGICRAVEPALKPEQD